MEEAKVAMTFKFFPYIKTLLQRLSGMDDRSMTNYLEQLIRREAEANGLITAKATKNNNHRK